jgi:hypothetical protein
MQYSTSYADPGLKMWDTFACATAKFLTHFIISISVLENVPPDPGLKKRATFSTLNVGLAGMGNLTRATCIASSVGRRSAIHNASKLLFGRANFGQPVSGRVVGGRVDGLLVGHGGRVVQCDVQNFKKEPTNYFKKKLGAVYTYEFT